MQDFYKDILKAKQEGRSIDPLQYLLFGPDSTAQGSPQKALYDEMMAISENLVASGLSQDSPPEEMLNVIIHMDIHEAIKALTFVKTTMDDANFIKVLNGYKEHFPLDAVEIDKKISEKLDSWLSGMRKHQASAAVSDGSSSIEKNDEEFTKVFMQPINDILNSRRKEMETENIIPSVTEEGMKMFENFMDLKDEVIKMKIEGLAQGLSRQKETAQLGQKVRQTDFSDTLSAVGLVADVQQLNISKEQKKEISTILLDISVDSALRTA